MFQSSDDFNLDQDFFTDPFVSETPSVEIPPLKKFCPQEKKDDFVFAVPSTSKPSENILDILRKVNKPKVDQNVRNVERSSPERGRKSAQRKFPGPAGLLPEKRIEINIKALENCDNAQKNKPETSEEIPSSQLSENCFKSALWEQMCKEYYIDNAKMYLPDKYSISWLKTKSMSRQLLGQKTPFLAAVIKSIDYSVKNPIVILKDPTGEIPGTIHYQVWDEFSDRIHVGCVIVLRQVGILSTHRKRYLNITSNNLIIVYSYRDYNKDLYRLSQSQTQRNLQMDVVRVNDMTREEILASIENFERNYKKLNTVSENDNPFFSNVSFNNNSKAQNSSYIDQSILDEFSNNLNSFLDKENSFNVSKSSTNHLINKQMKTNCQNDFQGTLYSKTKDNQCFIIPKSSENSVLSFPKHFPAPENQNSGIISATEEEKSIYSKVFSNRSANIPKNQNPSFLNKFSGPENQNSGIISATESEKDVYSTVFGRLNANKNFGNQEKSNMNFSKNFPGQENQRTGAGPAQSSGNFVFDRVLKKPELQNSGKIPEKSVTNFPGSENRNSGIISASGNEDSVYNKIFRPKTTQPIFQTAQNFVTEKSTPRTQNVMDLIFKNRTATSPKPSETSSIQNVSTDNDITFEIDDSLNFETSTQNTNLFKPKNLNNLEDSEDILAGLEDSFLEDF